MSVKNWWSTEKQKFKTFKKEAFKWIGIALAVILAALLIYGIYVLVKRNKMNAEAAQNEAAAAALQGGVVRRAYTAPMALGGGKVGWRMMGGQRIVPA